MAYPFAEPAALERMVRTGLVQRIDGRFETRTDPLLFEQTGTAIEWSEIEGALWAALAKLECPTRVVRGERSAMLREEVVHKMVDRVLRCGSAVSVPGAGHAVPVDNPRGLGDAIAGFLREVADCAEAPLH